VAGAVLATSFSVLSGWSEPQGPVLLALFVIAGACALSRPPARSSSSSER
jgi:hypothetical protein